MQMRTFVVTLALFALPALSDRQFVDITPTLVQPSMSGRDIFNYYCVSCHGRSGRGDGPVASALKTRPADLRRLAADNDGSFPVARVRAVLTTGPAPTPAHGSSDMPVWGPIFQALETDERARARIENLTAYLISIQSR
jgi:mono/diheme cytochrome c family protein